MRERFFYVDGCGKQLNILGDIFVIALLCFALLCYSKRTQMYNLLFNTLLLRDANESDHSIDTGLLCSRNHTRRMFIRAS